MGVGFVAKIVTIIIKSAVNSKIGSELGKELIGTSIDGVSERSITEINNFISGKKSKLEHILSEENMKKIYVAEENIDFVIAELKDLLSKVEITDELFRRCRYNPENLKVFLWDEYRRDKNIIENESDIEKGLDIVAETLIELVLESEEFEKDLIIHISNSVDDANVELQKISDYMHKNYGSMNEEIQMILIIVQMILEQIQNLGIEKQNAQRKIQSRTKEYADKWNANMFLNDFDEWDEKAGVNVKLKDVYVEKHLPHFIWGGNKNDSTNLNALLSQYIENTGENRMLLILGQPGIGKSTLITWITANFFDKVDSILVYQFANDLNNINWSRVNIFDEILNTLSLSLNDLEHKTLIFDGFDEINVGENRRTVLDKIYEDLIYRKNLKKFSLIITCRENYIKELKLLKCKYITLQPWDESQIKSFCHIFHKKAKNKMYESIIEKAVEIKDVFGIPLILYMVLALNISIEKEASIVDVYDKIFSLEGGIYDRCIDNKKFASSHRIGGVKKQIHQISRDIAMWMFENEPDEARIPQEVYQIICINVMQANEQENQDITQDFKIGGYFKLVHHCEGIETEELYFVHRSIYEYFVAETIFNSIENAIIDLSNESKKEFARNVAEYLKMGDISPTISQYLEYKIRKLYSSLETRKQRSFYRWWEDAIDKMMDVGMFYYSKPIQHYRDSMFMEVKCFINLVKMLRLVLRIEQKKYIMYNVKRESLENYIKYCATVYAIWRKKSTSERLDLSKMYLKGLDLHGIDLGEVELTDANLMEANLSDVNLVKTNLRGANLKGADLRKADLRETDLRKANLREADLRGAIVEYINNLYNNLGEQRLKSANLKEAYLNNSIWREKDICRVKQFRKAIFTNLVIEDENGRRKLGKNEIFPTKSKFF